MFGNVAASAFRCGFGGFHSVAGPRLELTIPRRKGDPIPYAPFIAGGGLVAMLISGTAFYSI